MASNTLRIGLVGAGFLAETRARCWQRVGGAQVLAVASHGGASARAFAEQHAVPEASADVAALLENPDIDVVDVCVPNAAHRKVVEAAAAAGKHVICTKPLAAYVGQDLSQDASDADIAMRDANAMREVAEADARAMADATERAGVALCYGENWLYAPSIRRAAQLLDEGDSVLLDMRGGEEHSGSHASYAKQWRHAGGGALLRLGAHPIGAMLHLKRREGLRRRGRPIVVTQVSAEVADLTRTEGLADTRVDIAQGWQDVENWGAATLHFDDGSRALAYGSDNRLGGMRSELQLFANNATLQCNLSPVDLVRAYTADDQVWPGANLIEKQSTTAGWSTPMPDEDWTSGQLGMCEAFARNLREGSAPEADAWLAIETTRILYAAYQSARSGARVAIDPASH